jgi:hypothetical protein
VVAQKANKIAKVKLLAEWAWGLKPYDRNNQIAEVCFPGLSFHFPDLRMLVGRLASCLASHALPCRLGQNLFALQTMENQATRQAGFTSDKAQSDEKVVWDDDDEDDDNGSSAAAEDSGATHDNDGSEVLEEQGESLSHSSKSPCPSSLRDWYEGDDDELEPSAALRATTLHVDAAATAGGKISPVVDVPDSPE